MDGHWTNGVLTLSQRTGLDRILRVAAGTIFVLLIVLGLVGQFAPALAGVLVLVAGLCLVRLLADASTRPFVLALFLAAFALRLVVAVATYYGAWTLGYAGIGDEVGYSQFASGLAQQWHGTGKPVTETWAGLYGTLSGILYYFAGDNMLVPKVVNAAIGASTAVLIWYWGTLLTRDARAARLAGILVAVMPSLVFWSALNIRDALGLALIVLTLLGAHRFFSSPTFGDWLLVLAPWFLQRDVRNWIYVPLSWLLPLGALWWPGLALKARVTALAAIGVVVLLVPYWMGDGWLGWNVVRTSGIEQERSSMATGANSAYVTPGQPSAQSTIVPSGPSATSSIVPPSDAGENKIVATLLHIPLGLAFVIGAPFPWMLYNWLARAAFAEMLVWYLLFLFALYALARQRRQWREWILVAAYVGGIALIMAVIEGNVGTLARHRAMLLMPFVLMYSAQGLVQFWEQRKRKAKSKPSVLSPG